MEEYVTVNGVSTAEYSEKRSRFIAYCYHCESEEEAQEYIAGMRSKYFDARHVVYAYCLADKTVRFSDDKEPHGTAAKPILDLINGFGICNVVLIVVRYFGGTLLGTGGLVRAYSTAAKGAIENAEKVKMCMSSVYDIECDYTLHSKLVSLLNGLGVICESTDFADTVKIKAVVFKENEREFLDLIADTFSSKIKPCFVLEKIYPRKIQDF